MLLGSDETEAEAYCMRFFLVWLELSSSFTISYPFLAKFVIFASVNFRNAWETVGEVDETVDLNLPNSVSVSPDDSSLLLALKF